MCCLLAFASINSQHAVSQNNALHGISSQTKGERYEKFSPLLWSYVHVNG